MKAYPEYKPSNTVWLGAVPSHWEKTALKYFLTQITDSSSSDNKVALENIESGTARYISTLSEFEGNGVEFKKGDILYGKLRPYLQKVWVAEFDGNAIGDFFVYRVNSRVITVYVKWLLLSNGFTEIVNNSTEGAKMPRVSSEFIKNLVFFLPPYEEQWKIAEYLCDITGKVDALITEKKRQVDDLRKYRTSLITETVTHGLNPTIPLKDSGIDWLGKIPKGLDINPLKYLTEEPLMYGANESPELETNLSNPRYIRITDISENGELREDSYRTLDFVKAQPYLLQSGDILFARSGATVGKTYRFDETYPACFAGYLIKARCSSKLNSKFLIYYTNSQSYNNWKNSIFDKSTIQNISADKYNQLPIPLPPIEEQKEIAAYLDEKTGKIDTLIAELEKQLEDLALYKKAVITEAVTGKIDVRDWAPKN